ncbi:MAG TPA: PRC-barrel domain-containing protein [Armatimonadota bacterium]|nr:PRC-barrel domain-containing protein [Armatimonadota bacterium]
MTTMSSTTAANPKQPKELIHINDLDRPALPVDFPDYRDLMVYDSQGVQVGRIVDMVIDRADRRPVMAVMLFGGFLDMGAKHVLLPFEWLQEPRNGTIRINATRELIAQAPYFNAEGHRDYSPFYDYWFPNPASTPDPSLPPLVENTAGGHSPLLRMSHANKWQIPDGVTDLRGREVVDDEGNSVGVIDDWFLSLKDHAATIVVIRRGGLLGAFAHETMVPFDRLEALDGDRYRIHASKEDIDYAPELKDEILNYAPFYSYWAHPGRRPNPVDTQGFDDTGSKVRLSAPTTNPSR